jgi:hypothetical protein
MNSITSPTFPSTPVSTSSAVDEQTATAAVIAETSSAIQPSVDSSSPSDMIDLTNGENITSAEGARDDAQTSTAPPDAPDDNPHSEALEEFTPFPKLPIELRLRIWKFTLPGPRILEVAYCEAGSDSDMPEKFGVATRPPVALRVCRESRREASRFYTLSFGSENWASKIYFDFSIDTLYLNCLTIGQDGVDIERFLREAEGIENVRTIAACLLTCDILEVNIDDFDKRLTSLETLICADHGEYEHREGGRNGEHLRIEFTDAETLAFSETVLRDKEVNLKRRLLCGTIMNDVEEA